MTAERLTKVANPPTPLEKFLADQLSLIPSRVSAGIQELDANPRSNPNWRDRIDRKTFDIQLSDSCVIGQVFRQSFSAAIELLTDNACDDNWDSDRGFDRPAWYDLRYTAARYGDRETAARIYCDELQAEWSAQLWET